MTLLTGLLGSMVGMEAVRAREGGLKGREVLDHALVESELSHSRCAIVLCLEGGEPVSLSSGEEESPVLDLDWLSGA